jgi:uncharacterized protein YdhG (YjbR/CyaY superfamily)
MTDSWGFFTTMRSPAPIPRSVPEYLARLSREQRTALQQLRRTIRAAAPGAKECISYGVPAYYQQGKLLVAFGAARKHCAFYPGAHPVRANRQELRAFDTSKGTVRFQPGCPLPAALVRRLVKCRLTERGG